MANIIEFSCTPEYFNYPEVEKPIPIKLNIPEWYKKLEHTLAKKTAKGCMPFLDTLTTGYLLKLPQDIRLEYNKFDEQGRPIIEVQYSVENNNVFYQANLNINGNPQIHPTEQLKNSPFISTNGGRPFHKILNPWRIKTPKGYSCLFVSPLNNHHEPWSIIPGIVDTDTWNLEINFPMIVNTEKIKNPKKEFIMKKGTPYVQIIPFKKESWKMDVNSNKKKGDGWLFPLTLLHTYKNTFWKKIKWT